MFHLLSSNAITWLEKSMSLTQVRQACSERKPMAQKLYRTDNFGSAWVKVDGTSQSMVSSALYLQPRVVPATFQKTYFEHSRGKPSVYSIAHLRPHDASLVACCRYLPSNSTLPFGYIQHFMFGTQIRQSFLGLSMALADPHKTHYISCSVLLPPPPPIWYGFPRTPPPFVYIYICIYIYIIICILGSDAPSNISSSCQITLLHEHKKRPLLRTPSEASMEQTNYRESLTFAPSDHETGTLGLANRSAARKSCSKERGSQLRGAQSKRSHQMGRASSGPAPGQLG